MSQMNVSTPPAHDSCTLDTSISTPISTPRLRRDSKPTPPDRLLSKKSRLQMSTDSLDMEPNIEHILSEQSGVLKSCDLQNIAEAVKAALVPDIRKLISAATAPLEHEIVSLKAENAKLRDSIDGLEQYGRRPLIRVTGINETDPSQNEDTVTQVVNVLKKIDNEFQIHEVERAHRIGKPSNQYSRQIIVRLKSPGIKHRILKTAKNLKDLPSYSHVRLNEDLTATRSKLAFICRKLVKSRDIKQTWTIDGKIFIKDRTDAIHRANSETEFNDMMNKLNITVPVVESKRRK